MSVQQLFWGFVHFYPLVASLRDVERAGENSYDSEVEVCTQRVTSNAVYSVVKIDYPQSTTKIQYCTMNGAEAHCAVVLVVPRSLG